MVLIVITGADIDTCVCSLFIIDEVGTSIILHVADTPISKQLSKS